VQSWLADLIELEREMLAFEKGIHADFPRGYVIYANDPTDGRVRCAISSLILVDNLGSETAIKDDLVRKLYETKRAQIELALQRAFDARPGEHIELQARDFQ
jgi:hypothetical protein